VAETGVSNARANFLDALDRLHERFLVGVEGVTEVWLARHADAYTEWRSMEDRAGIDQAGRIDPPLSGQGRREAEALGKRVGHAGISAIYCSDIGRAQETAEIAGRRLGIGPRVDPRLREMKTAWEHPPGADGNDSRAYRYIPFVEPVAEVIERMGAAMRDIVATAPGERVLAVSHAGAITAYLCHVLQLDFGQLRVLPRYTSVSVLVFKDDLAVVQSIADIGHLSPRQSGG